MKPRTAWAWGVLAVLLLSMPLLRLRPPGPAPLLQQEPTLPSPGQPGLHAKLPPSPEALAPEPPVTSTAAPPPAAAAPSAPTDTWAALKALLGFGAREPLVLDLCGVGRMPITKPAQPGGAEADTLALLPPHLGSEAQAQALQNLLARLDTGPPRWRATATLLRGSDADGQPSAAALRRRAQETNDPVEAVLALQACKQDAACRVETAQRWLQLEPDNLAALMEAHGNTTQVDLRLLARMAAARQHRLHLTAPIQVVMEAMASDASSYLQPGVWVYVLGFQAAFVVPPFSPLVQMCPDNMAADNPAKPLCAAVAKTLVEHSDTMLGNLIGLRLAERTYLSKPEAAQQRAALNAMMQPDPALMNPMPTSCASVEGWRASMLRLGQLGEVAASRAQAAERAASAARAAGVAAR